MLEASIRKAIHSSVNHPELREILDYAVLPAGKLFRPRLVEAMALDLSNGFSADHLHLACALELHHAYTLVHDDLPSMDNDLIRRGKPSTHARYGEWKAILAGDALIIASFEELMKIKSPVIRELHKIFTWCTGGKGLILGQFLDMGSLGKLSTPEIVRIHELKTARLIQVAVSGAALITQEKFSREYFRLGRDIGISFQLLDDLNELTEEQLSPHEKDINPFLLNRDLATKNFISCYRNLWSQLKIRNLRHLETLLSIYFEENRKKLSERMPVLARHLGPEIKDDLRDFVS